ncbi:MAG TPA: AAA family ATPase [Blastocatellia bacterium]|nr:AAA family ATPase [Blastocatellia bacterium]HMV83201.1 AAA family ATPase [Blastocatellia bacterium]HMX26433.1 AAA family ATPase [Blastocatellia bacterium]HMY73770.1 AAA family ATPase [Blastocatellia bacterium]HMZ21066.1 AAA family ATPase [Blastocatellia bacterium]
MIHLQSIGLKPTAKKQSGFPFTLPLVQHFGELELGSPVTFFVGENGSGKSTLIEAIAAGLNLATVGGEDIARDNSLRHARALGKQLAFSWRNKTHRGFFLRAEDFFNFAKRLQTTLAELQNIADSFDGEYSGYALGLAKGSVLGQRRELIERYGEDLDANSHGESFLKLFQSRFVPGGLYLLDEPEAPLSPQRQLALLSMVKEMVAQDAQFLIATHSPILMAYPEATIFSFDVHPIREIAYDDVEHVSLTRAFLNNPNGFLRRL